MSKVHNFYNPDELESYILKLKDTYEMLHKRTGRPDPDIKPEDTVEGMLNFIFTLGVNGLGHVKALDNPIWVDTVTIKSALLNPFLETKIYGFPTLKDFYNAVDRWYDNETSLSKND